MTIASKKTIRMQKRNAAREEEKQKRRETVIESVCRKADRNILNQKSQFATADEEIKDRDKVAVETLKVYRRYLPGILKDLSKIEDPRNPKKLKHNYHF